ncbi:MAG: hypothetical protein NC429_04725 [Lachnospiraceae bacterium]|nr:hypothetical protein [Lachnospiraceae bacterium]
MKVLKIYIVEDDMRRYRTMEAYFEAVKGEVTLGKGVGEFSDLLKRVDIGEIEINHIKINSTPSEEPDFIDYSYDENFEDYIKKILDDRSPRFFFLDLALNKQEREIFSRNENMLVPYVARQIINSIGQKQSLRKELVVVNTRCTNISRSLEMVLDIKKSVKENLILKIIPANIFAPTYVRKQKDHVLSEIVKDFLEEKKENG